MDHVLSSYAVFRFLKKYKCFKFGVNRFTTCPSRIPRSPSFWFGVVRVVFCFVYLCSMFCAQCCLCLFIAPSGFANVLFISQLIE
jgi:hypothetical protein